MGEKINKNTFSSKRVNSHNCCKMNNLSLSQIAAAEEKLPIPRLEVMLHIIQ